MVELRQRLQELFNTLQAQPQQSQVSRRHTLVPGLQPMSLSPALVSVVQSEAYLYSWMELPVLS